MRLYKLHGNYFNSYVYTVKLIPIYPGCIYLFKFSFTYAMAKKTKLTSLFAELNATPFSESAFSSANLHLLFQSTIIKGFPTLVPRLIIYSYRGNHWTIVFNI